MTQQLANAVRFLAADMVSKAGSGHPGMPLGMADVFTVLWTRFLNFDPTCPNWYNRDRFVLSNGHGSAALYALLYLTGFPNMTLDEIKNFRQWGSQTPGIPKRGTPPALIFPPVRWGRGWLPALGWQLLKKWPPRVLGVKLFHIKHTFLSAMAV